MKADVAHSGPIAQFSYIVSNHRYIELLSTTLSTQDIVRVLEVSSSSELLQLTSHDSRHESVAHKNVMVAMASEHPRSAGPKRNHNFIADSQVSGPHAEMLIVRLEEDSLVT